MKHNLRIVFRGPSCFMAALSAVMVLSLAGAAHGQLRVVNYNVAKVAGNHNALENVLRELMYDDTPGYSVPVSVFVFQEVRNADLAVLEDIVNDAAPPGEQYVVGTYTNINRDPVAGAQAMFYRAGVLLEVPSAHKDIFTGAGRYADRWRLRLLGYDSPDAGFYIYSAHLKASPGSDNQQQRLAGVQAIRSDADALPAGAHVLFAGDMNFYHNNEPGYQHFFEPGNGQAIDPLGTGSFSGPGNAIKHTQSPRANQSGGLVGGGLDDRFDFQLGSLAMHDDAGLAFIDDTYRAFGNDGQHYDTSINDGNNFYFPGDLSRSNALADALHDASDHVPVVADYQIPARMAAAVNPSNIGAVIRDTALEIDFVVQNTAPYVASPVGADVLNYTATGSGDVLGEESGTALATELPGSGSLAIKTSSLGEIVGTVTFTSDNQGVQNAEIVRNVSGSVLRPCYPSFSDETLEQSRSLEYDYDLGDGEQFITVAIHNLGFDFDDWQARMDVDTVEGVEAPFSVEGGLEEGVGSTPAMLELSFDPAGLPADTYNADVTIHLSDEDIPGESEYTLSLQLSVTLGDAPPCEGDFTGDGLVNVSDMLQLLGAWGPCSGCDEDLTDDGVVNVSDLLTLLSNWGGCP